jgi:2-aminoadipate transaminase
MLGVKRLNKAENKMDKTFNFANRFEGISGSAIRAIFSLLSDPKIISFAGGNPSALTFPKDKLSKITEEILKKDGARILQYGGTLGIKEMILTAKELFESEGLTPREREIIILSGASQGIELMTKAFINPGDAVLVESPSFLGALQIFKIFEAKLVEVEMDEHGIVLEDLEKKIKEHNPKFLYTIPTFQNPTGRTLPLDRRKGVADLAKKYGTMILEDDPYAALRYTGTGIPSVKSFDEENMVVKLMSFSKTISPGLRMGAAYADKDVIHKFNLGKQGMDLHTANLNQKMVAEFIKRGYLPGQIEANCNLYRGKLKLMCDLIDAHFPEGTKFVRPQGGMFVWVELSKKLNATELFKKAVEKKVAYVPGTHFYAGGGHHNTLRLNFTMVDEEKIEQGIKELSNLLKQELCK